MASMQASPWLPELEVTKKSPCAIFFSGSSSGLDIYEDENNKIRNEGVSSSSPPSVSFWTTCCEPLATWSCLSAAPEGCSILVSSCWVGDRVKRSSKKKNFCLFHLEEESARDDGWHCWRRHNPGMSWLHGLVEIQYEETKNSLVLALFVMDVIQLLIARISNSHC